MCPPLGSQALRLAKPSHVRCWSSNFVQIEHTACSSIFFVSYIYMSVAHCRYVRSSRVTARPPAAQSPIIDAVV